MGPESLAGRERKCQTEQKALRPRSGTHPTRNRATAAQSLPLCSHQRSSNSLDFINAECVHHCKNHASMLSKTKEKCIHNAVPKVNCDTIIDFLPWTLPTLVQSLKVRTRGAGGRKPTRAPFAQDYSKCLARDVSRRTFSPGQGG